MQGQYDYDAWGSSVVIKGKIQVDFGYTGHYFHQPSGLNLTLKRPYIPPLGRWMSRDPLQNAEMLQGANLYWYVGNNPVNATDPLGLDARTILLPFGISFTVPIPFTEHPVGEAEHEKQHRDDWWNDQSMPGWKMEQRGFAAEAAALRKRIAELESKEHLTADERSERERDKLDLATAENIANSDAKAKEYWNRVDRWPWQKEVK